MRLSAISLCSEPLVSRKLSWVKTRNAVSDGAFAAIRTTAYPVRLSPPQLPQAAGLLQLSVALRMDLGLGGLASMSFGVTYPIDSPVKNPIHPGAGPRFHTTNTAGKGWPILSF